MSEFNQNLDLILLNIGYSELNANWNWTKIYSPFARIYYVEGGEAITRFGDKTYLLRPGHLYLTPPFTLHDDECDSFFALYYIHFYEKVINQESLFDKYTFPLEIEASSLDLALTKRLLHINPDRYLKYYDPKIYDNPPTFSQYLSDSNKMEAHYALETRGILYQLLSRFVDHAEAKSSNIDVRINNALKYIHENSNKNVSISELADIACITEDHFTRVFKREMSCTPVKYINQKKIEKAQLLLLTTRMSISDIAFELSFDNVSYFNKIFKQHANVTPSEYRRKYSK